MFPLSICASCGLLRREKETGIGYALGAYPAPLGLKCKTTKPGHSLQAIIAYQSAATKAAPVGATSDTALWLTGLQIQVAALSTSKAPLIVTMRIFSNTPRISSVPQLSSSSLGETYIRSGQEKQCLERVLETESTWALLRSVSPYPLITLPPPGRGYSEIRLQLQEEQIKYFNFLPVWFAAKAGPRKTFPASEREAITVTVTSPPSIPGSDKHCIFSLISLSEARQRGNASMEKTPAHWNPVLDLSQLLDTLQLLAIHLFEYKCQKELARPLFGSEL